MNKSCLPVVNLPLPGFNSVGVTGPVTGVVTTVAAAAAASA